MIKENIKIDIKSKRLTATLKGIGFKEGEYFIIYIPSLNVSGYGVTEQEANELVKITLENFSEELFKMNENKIFEQLKSLGWQKNRIFNKRMSNLSETTFEDIIKEFNLPKETKLQEMPIAV
tara:strand:+ start:3740 stop:4105 length:366 start_codon:yes stop_codon:yes gene_type:complete